MEIKDRIGTRIKEIRLALSMTQEAVAFRAEIDRTYMNHVETGKRNVSMATLEKIVVNGLGKDLCFFFSDGKFRKNK